jgi:hypothetical protein
MFGAGYMMQGAGYNSQIGLFTPCNIQHAPEMVSKQK